MNKSKAKGTSAETAVVRYLQSHGWPLVERRTLQGVADRGDVAGLPLTVVEVKSCASYVLAEWIKEAAVERVHAKARFGFVWFKRRGFTDPAKWFVLMEGEQFMELYNFAHGVCQEPQ